MKQVAFLQTAHDQIENEYAKHNLPSSDDLLILIWQLVTASPIRMCAHTDSSINSANMNIDVWHLSVGNIIT